MDTQEEFIYDDSTSVYAILSAKPVPVETIFQYEKEKRPEYSERIDEIANYNNQRLFCQLMQCTTKYFEEAPLTGEESVSFLYSVILPLEKRLSLQSVVDLIWTTVDRLEISDALLLISKFETLLDSSSNVYICLQLCKVNVFIRANRLLQASDILFGRLSKMMENKIGVDLHTNSCFYKTCSNYFRSSNNSKELYDCLTLYLAYTPLNQVEEKNELAFELCIAGLVAPGMFDFGELRTNPILTTLYNDPERQWILEVLEAALEGSLTLYKTVKQKYADLIQKTFKDKVKDLDKKMTLAALIELAFQQPKENRKISLQQIAEYCDITMAQVCNLSCDQNLMLQCERLLMKTMSLQLIKGSIDEVSSTLYITWVKPRLVDADRVGILKSRFVAWSENIAALITHLESATKDILAT